MAGAAIAVAATAIPSAIFLILDSPLNLPARLVIPAGFAGNKTRASKKFHGGATHSHSPDIQGFRRHFVPAPDAREDRKASGEVHFASFCCVKATPLAPLSDLPGSVLLEQKMAGAIMLRP
jgi:hypothetical protein